MGLGLLQLPQDVLILVCLRLPIEDVLTLMQTCRVMHALGSLDYLWHRLLSDWDLPLDIPLNTTLYSLSSDTLRKAVVNALKLDNRWRDPHLEMHCAQRVISHNSSFVDGMRLLPGGRWLVTLQYEQTARTHVTLWSIKDTSDSHSIFKATVTGRVRFLHAHHHHELEQITIGIAFARGSAESIRVYDIPLDGDSSTRHSLVFDATSSQLSSIGRIAGMKIIGNILVAVFAPVSSSLEHEGRIVCLNLVSKAAALIECPDWSFAWGRLKLFRRYFAVTTSRYTPQHTSAYISFYEIPPAILDDSLPLSGPCWPETLPIKGSPIASASWRADSSLVFELSDDVSTTNAGVCSFTMFGYSIPPPLTVAGNPGVDIVRISFDGSNIECHSTVVPCRSLPSVGEVRVSASGRRAVWLNPDPDTQECTLMKFSMGRRVGSKELGPCISTLMPSFSGLPFNPRDFHSFAYDEISCKMVITLPSGELYVLHY